LVLGDFRFYMKTNRCERVVWLSAAATCLGPAFHKCVDLLRAGVDLSALNLPEWDTWVLVGFVCFHVVTEIIMEIISAVYGHIDGKLTRLRG